MLTEMMEREKCISMIHDKSWELIGSWTMLLNSVNKSLKDRIQFEFNEEDNEEQKN